VCGHRWCCYAHSIYPMPFTRNVACGLGCVRFSAEVQRLVDPSEFLHEDFDWLLPCRDCGGKGCWRYLDTRIAWALFEHGIFPHVHGYVEHHHVYPDDWGKAGPGERPPPIPAAEAIDVKARWLAAIAARR